MKIGDKPKVGDQVLYCEQGAPKKPPPERERERTLSGDNPQAKSKSRDNQNANTKPHWIAKPHLLWKQPGLALWLAWPSGFSSLSSFGFSLS